MSNNKLRVFEGFAGIGAVSKAIERLGISHELVGFSEIDKYAIKSFCAVHGVDESLNWGDVCKIDETKLPDMDLYTFGSPCQDFSVAGKQRGSTWTCNDCGHEYNPLDVHWSKRDTCPNCNNKNINKSRSSLVVEALRIIRHKKPKYLLMENVKNLVGKQFKPSFDKIIAELEEYGYNAYWDVLNAKNYGVPQNRERVFVISIRKDIDTGLYKFPKGFDNGVRLKDILEEHIADKYYLSQDVQNRFKFISKQILETNKLIQAGNMEGGKWDKINESCRRVYDEEGLAPTIHTCQGGNTEPKVITREITEPTVCEQRCDEGLRFFKDNICGALRTIDAYGDKRIIEPVTKEDTHKMIVEGNTVPSGHTGTAGSTVVTDNFKIRKLTPIECWLLMGFEKSDVEKCRAVGMSDTQLYKQAGNSIVVNCLEYMFKELFITSVKSLHNIG